MRGMKFTIRELLILTVAVAALLAWGLLAFQRQRPHQPTPFLDKHFSGWSKDLVAVRKALNENGPVATWGMSGRHGVSAYYHEESYDFSLSPANVDAFMDAFCKRMSEVAKETGCEGSHPPSEFFRGNEEKRFVVGYRHGRVTGDASAVLTRKSDQKVRLSITFLEFEHFTGE